MFSSLLNPGIVQQATQTLTSNVNGQTLMNYASTPQQKLGELGNKLGLSGMASMFTGMTPAVALKEINGVIVAADAGTGAVLDAIGAGRQASVPPSAVGTSYSNAGKTDQFKVTLSASPMIGDADSNVVVFDVMPSIDESRTATYDSVDILHHPGKLMKYKSTESRTWRITADLVSRTVQEADKNFKIMNIIRSWVMPFYGIGTAEKYPDKLGGPPQIITLKAYGPRMIGPVPCVVTDYNWIFENDRDYIPTSDGIPFPVHLRVSLSLTETYAPSEFTKFDLDLYRQGYLPAAFGGAMTQQRSPGTTGGIAAGGASTIDVSQVQTATTAALASANQLANAIRGAVGSASAGLVEAGRRAVSSGVAQANGVVDQIRRGI